MKPFYKAAVQLSFAALLLFQTTVFSQPPTIGVQSVATGISVPVDIVNAGDGSNRLFIVQQNGVILVREASAPFTVSQFMDLGNSTPSGLDVISYTAGGERGLLSMAFHPDYNGSTNSYFFVYYTDPVGNITIRRYETMPGPGTPSVVANTSAGSLLIMSIPHTDNSNHNGGKLNFGSDGYLYFATGDGGGGNDVPNNAQNGNVLLGKMIRIDINNPVAQAMGNYNIPADNPYRTDPSVADEVWALGLRNPFRWSFDRLTNDMWIGDVGQGAKEEVDFRPAGSTGHVNYGWRCFEGFINTPTAPDCTPTDNVFPVYDYDNPPSGSSAVTGGYVYRGNEFASFRGYYIAADVYSGTIHILWPNGSGGFDSSAQAAPTVTGIVGFGEAEDGTLYVVRQTGSNATSGLYKITSVGGAPLPVTLKNFTVQHFNNYNELKWSTAFEQGTSKFYIEYSTDGNRFLRAGQISASRNSDGSSYSYQHYFSGSNDVLYRLAMEEDNGRVNYSSILRVTWGTEKTVKIYPTVIDNGILNLSFSVPASKLQVMNSNGAVVFEKGLNNYTGATVVNLPVLSKGVYMVKIFAKGEASTHKIIIR